MIWTTEKRNQAILNITDVIIFESKTTIFMQKELQYRMNIIGLLITSPDELLEANKEMIEKLGTLPNG